jgi:large subunit ribosomal protein L10
MVLTKEQKKQSVEKLISQFEKSKSAVFANYQGLKVDDIERLRTSLRERGADFKIVKNTLVKIALKNSNKTVDDKSIFDYPLAIAFGYDDEVTAPKQIFQFSRTNEAIKILGGFVDSKYVNEQEIKNLALIPSKSELYLRIVQSLYSPIAGFVNVVAGPGRGITNIMRQYLESKS